MAGLLSRLPDCKGDFAHPPYPRYNQKNASADWRWEEEWRGDTGERIAALTRGMLRKKL